MRELAFKVQTKKGKKVGRKGRILTSKESKRIRRRGYRAERELVKKLRGLDFKAVRVPVSAPSSEPLPDVFAVKGSCILAFEIKAPTAEKSYFRKEQVKKLFGFLEMFEAYDEKIAVLVAKFPYKWCFKCVKKIDDYVVSKDETDNIKMDQIKP